MEGCCQNQTGLNLPRVRLQTQTSTQGWLPPLAIACPWLRAAELWEPVEGSAVLEPGRRSKRRGGGGEKCFSALVSKTRHSRLPPPRHFSIYGLAAGSQGDGCAGLPLRLGWREGEQAGRYAWVWRNALLEAVRTAGPPRGKGWGQHPGRTRHWGRRARLCPPVWSPRLQHGWRGAGRGGRKQRAMGVPAPRPS